MFLTHTQYEWVACVNFCHKDKLYIQNGDADTFNNNNFLKSDPVNWIV